MPDPVLPTSKSFVETIQSGVDQLQQQATIPSHLRSLPQAMATIFRVIIYAAVVVFMIMMLFGAITYLSSSGNEEGTARGRRLMLDSTIGLVLTLAAYGISAFILNQFGFRIP